MPRRSRAVKAASARDRTSRVWAMARARRRRHITRMNDEGPSGSPGPLEVERLHARVADSLIDARTVLIYGEITSELAHATCARLLALSAKSRAPVRVFIHSP